MALGQPLDIGSQAIDSSREDKHGMNTNAASSGGSTMRLKNKSIIERYGMTFNRFNSK